MAGLPDFAHVPFYKGLSVHRIMLGGAYIIGGYEAQAELGQMGEEMIGMVADGRIDPMISEVIPLEGVPAGFEKLAGRYVRGKIVAAINNKQ